MASSRNSTVKIIDKDLRFRPEAFEDYLKQKRFNCELSVCITGSQSGGKSSLLNALLGEPIFKVMNEEHGYSQTTLGIDIVISNKWLVMDFEGSDSGEREKQEQISVQYKLGLFSLMVSDIILLNVFSNEIGRASANYKVVLKVIFETYLKYYDTDSQPKKLFVVLRDCPRKMTAYTVQEKVLNDLLGIWNSIEKSDEEFQNLFELIVIALHYKEYSLVPAEIDELRAILTSYQREDQIRTQEMPSLFNDLWTKIMSDEGLDSILSVKDMIDASKCRSIIEKCMIEKAHYAAQIKALASQKFLDLEQIHSDFLEQIENEILGQTRSISRRVKDQEMNKMKKEIENIFNELVITQNNFILKEISEIKKQLKLQLQSRNLDVVFILDFLKEFSNSSAWKESSLLDSLRKGVQVSLNEFFSMVKKEIKNEIDSLNASSRDELISIEMIVKEKIDEVSANCSNLVRNLSQLVDETDGDYNLEDCYLYLAKMISILSMQFEKSDLENKCLDAEAKIKIEEELKEEAQKMVSQLKEEKETAMEEEKEKREKIKNEFEAINNQMKTRMQAQEKELKAEQLKNANNEKCLNLQNIIDEHKNRISTLETENQKLRNRTICNYF